MTIEQAYEQLKEAKLKRRVLTRQRKDELESDPAYKTALEELEKAKARVREIKASHRNDDEENQLAGLRVEIGAQMELIADIALNMYVDGKTVEVDDPIQGKLSPRFSVKFTKK